MGVGEDASRTGEDGARRAKRWLEATMRVKQAWTNEDKIHVSRMSFPWPHNKESFSYDVGGILAGDEYEGHFFLAESKKYASAADQGTHFDNWMAKCYVVKSSLPMLADHFMWITWAPFRITSWKDLCSEKAVRAGVLTELNRQRVLGTKELAEAEVTIDDELVKAVASSLWIIVLSDKQEKLVISPQHRSWILERAAMEDWSA